MTTTVASAPQTENQLPVVYQYTVEAYKAFQKLAEMLPNPVTAQVFKKMAESEREHRDLLDIKYSDPSVPRMQITLGGDLRFQDMLEGDLSYREIAEMLIGREKTMAEKLIEFSRNATENDRNLFGYIGGAKRSHIVLLERELELLLRYPDWFKREDAESLIVHGKPAE
ncbi:MAG: ferritin family protein [Acidobacteriota bacterium]